MCIVSALFVLVALVGLTERIAIFIGPESQQWHNLESSSGCLCLRMRIEETNIRVSPYTDPNQIRSENRCNLSAQPNAVCVK
ncbi:hypothetical protein F4860DRAFT_461063 [Xylaria cubensis]|nr:hypothetical protein F4860DRAFT_461063 [Xylaria cubensis]